MTITGHIKIEKTARYFQLGELTVQTKKVVFALHGYAQQAKEFIAELESLQDFETVIIAPEGLNRFYAKGFGGKPVAAWMTSEDREHEILDYINYLNALYDQLIPPSYTGRIVVLGFSQGVATASRWIHHSLHRFTDFIICSGDIAVELRNPLSEKICALRCCYISGNDDPFLTKENKLIVNALMTALNAQIYIFEGGHQLHIPSIENVL